MRVGMSMRWTELLLTLTRNACKCDRLTAGFKGAAFLGHFYMRRGACTAAILFHKGQCWRPLLRGRTSLIVQEIQAILVGRLAVGIVGDE